MHEVCHSKRFIWVSSGSPSSGSTPWMFTIGNQLSGLASAYLPGLFIGQTLFSILMPTTKRTRHRYCTRYRLPVHCGWPNKLTDVRNHPGISVGEKGVKPGAARNGTGLNFSGHAAF